MTVKEFQLTLKNELIRRGIDEATAESQTYKLIKTFTDDDFREIDRYRTPADFKDISESLLEITMITAIEEELDKKKAEGVSDSDINSASGTREFKVGGEVDSYDALSKTKTTPILFEKELNKSQEDEIYLEDGYFGDGTEFTPRTRAKFIGLAIATSPLWIILFSVIVAMFGITLLSVFGIIAAFIILALGLVCIGVLVLIISLVFGFTQIAEVGIGPGLFEMGLGFLCFAAGIVLAVLSYNLAVRVLPKICKQIFALWKSTWRRIAYYIAQIKEEIKKS